MKTVNQLIERTRCLALENPTDTIVGISIAELASLTRTITTLRVDLDKATKSICREKQLSTAIYAEAMLECSKNRYEERV